MDKELSGCYEEIFTKVVELQDKYSDPMIAGNLMVHALRIYKSILNERIKLLKHWTIVPEIKKSLTLIFFNSSENTKSHSGQKYISS